MIDLPAGATPVDFAYQIHSIIGNTTVGARVNGKIFPLSGELRSGDVVEIITQKKKFPSESWLGFVKTGYAKNHIKAAMKTKENVLKKTTPTKIELKITAPETPGLFNEISDIITRSHVPILSVMTPQLGDIKIQTTKIILPMLGKDKTEKLVIKLKTLKAVKEINYRFM